MSDESRYLLLLACSQRKRLDPGLLPALERYDGVNFRVLKKAYREGRRSSRLRVLIISAEYGLLDESDPIADYDRRMTRARAAELGRNVSSRLDQVLRETVWQHVFVNLGRVYAPTIGSSEDVTRLGTKVTYARGGIGQKMALMKQWLLDIRSGDARD